jgi:hypothetical protein
VVRKKHQRIIEAVMEPGNNRLADRARLVQDSGEPLSWKSDFDVGIVR